MRSPEAELADYLEENYGECELGSARCYHGPGPQCLKSGWKGILCPHWKPLGVKTWEELREKASKRQAVEAGKENGAPDMADSG